MSAMYKVSMPTNAPAVRLETDTFVSGMTEKETDAHQRPSGSHSTRKRLARTRNLTADSERTFPECFNSISSLYEVTGDEKKDSLWDSYIPDNPEYITLHETRPLPPPPSLFARARQAGCLLPDPLSEQKYFTVSPHGPMARSLSVWTLICNFLADSP